MYPDGGIVGCSTFFLIPSFLPVDVNQARFRVYGHVSPVYPSDISSAFDLAHVFSGGRVVYVSDQHFGVGSNLLLPGRGVNMGDGWETKRSRVKGHKDWVIIKLCVTVIRTLIEAHAVLAEHLVSSSKLRSTLLTLRVTIPKVAKWVLCSPKTRSTGQIRRMRICRGRQFYPE